MLRRNRRLLCAVIASAAMLSAVFAVAAERQDVVQTVRPKQVVTIKADGSVKKIETTRATVGQALLDAGVAIGPKDMVMPNLDYQIKKGLIITVVRVQEVTEEITKPVPCESVKRFTNELKPGKVQLVEPGKDGEKVITHQVRYEDGRAVRKTLVAVQMTKDPQHREVVIGSRSRYLSRGAYTTRKTLRMSASAYDPGPRSCGKYATGRTACGLRAGRGVVAVDPRVIKLGSKLYIEGYGFAIAGDTGGAIKGNKIDLGFDSYSEAIRFGRKWVIVHILSQ